MSLDLPIVAIGGTLCDRRIWAPVLGGQGDDVVIVTAGQVDGTATSCPDMASYVQELLDSLPDRFILAGFSLGGLIALELIAQRPDRVAAIAIICAATGAETEQGAARRRSDEALAMARGMAGHARIDIWPRFQARYDTALPIFVSMAEAVGTHLYRRQNDLAISRLDSSERIGDIKVPVLMVSGANDALCPPERLTAACARIPHARHVTIENAGHMLALEQPVELAALLDGWIDEVKRVPAAELAEFRRPA